MKALLNTLTIIVLSISPVFAEAFVIEAYDVQIDVSENGYFDITETIDVQFTERRRGIFRTLPLTVRVDGEKFRMRYSHVDVHDWNYTTYNESGKFVIRIGDADRFIDGRQRYVIEYRVKGAFLWYEDHMEFHWNVIGNEWPVPVNNVTYRIEFPVDAYFASEDYGVATGVKGSRATNATIERNGQVLIGQTTRSLKPGEGMSVAVRLPPDAIQKPDDYREPYRVTRDFTALIPAGLAALILGFWRRKGRNARIAEEEVPDEYYPPEGLSAAEVGTIFDHKANTRDVIALIPEWGNQGVVRVGAVDDRSDDMLLEKTGELRDDAPEYEKMLFSKLFASRGEVWVADLKNKFYSTVSRVKKALVRSVRHDRLYDMDAYKTFKSGWFLLLFFAGLAAGIFVLVKTGWILTGIACFVLGVVGLVIHAMPPKRTEEGIALKRRLTGLRNFLRDTPEDRIDELVKEDPEYFSRMLPYAVAFGLDSAWIKFFERRPETMAPIWWYYGVPGMHHRDRVPMSSFGNHFDVKSVSSAFTSSPSSSGSGSSGGGFSGSSGGGFGGGGGGSW